jgi:hypothetical protein
MSQLQRLQLAAMQISPTWKQPRLGPFNGFVAEDPVQLAFVLSETPRARLTDDCWLWVRSHYYHFTSCSEANIIEDESDG